MIDNFDNITKPFNEFLINYFEKRPIKGIEIGVLHGLNSIRFLNTLNIDKLYLVDPYIGYTEERAEGKYKTTTTSDARLIYITAKKNLKDYKNIKFIRKESIDAIKDIEDTCDFVYIDGNHSYNIVKSDIELYTKIIKEGGIVGGDDYIPRWSGVMKAVDEFVNKNEYELYTEKYKVATGKTPEGWFYGCDWWIKKL